MMIPILSRGCQFDVRKNPGPDGPVLDCPWKELYLQIIDAPENSEPRGQEPEELGCRSRRTSACAACAPCVAPGNLMLFA